VRVEIVAVGTELLLGQIPDTNSQWLGEQLAAHGIASQFHQHVATTTSGFFWSFAPRWRAATRSSCAGTGTDPGRQSPGPPWPR